MTQHRLKKGYYTLEGINAFATAFYFNYLFFFMQARFGYGNLENLLLSATNGFIYMCAAWQGGRFAQRFGYFTALWSGFGTMCLALLGGCVAQTQFAHWSVMAVWTLGMCFTWPTLEALVSEGETLQTLPGRIGIYNLTWAGGSALAYFTGGALLELLGDRSLFLVPAGLHLAQLALLGWLHRGNRRAIPPAPSKRSDRPPEAPAAHAAQGRAKMFLRLAWLANPFAYVAINTIIAVIPGLAKRHDLSPMWAGFFCSLWLFSRMGAFAVLWLWSGWHYRFRWFVAAYFLVTASFAVILLSPALWPVMVAQVTFGAAVGLVYYSSLFYSMDVGETKGEHGGIHEAAIGAGIFGGPAVGTAALALFPGETSTGVWAVAGLLMVGGAAIVGIRWRSWRSEVAPDSKHT
ncbi:MAG TPA: MFS transporter [Verrucomicrobiae bacterium]|nr:MFS transporter [Verrucomicrobiae bacterium]